MGDRAPLFRGFVVMGHAARPHSSFSVAARAGLRESRRRDWLCDGLLAPQRVAIDRDEIDAVDLHSLTIGRVEMDGGRWVLHGLLLERVASGLRVSSRTVEEGAS